MTRRVLQRHASAVQRLPVPGPSAYGLSRLRWDREVSREKTRAAMRERFEQIHALATKGLSNEAIARQLGVNRQTVYEYLRLRELRTRHPISRSVSALAP